MFLHLRLNGTFFLFAPIGLVDRRLDRRPVLGRKRPGKGTQPGALFEVAGAPERIPERGRI